MEKTVRFQAPAAGANSRMEPEESEGEGKRVNGRPCEGHTRSSPDAEHIGKWRSVAKQVRNAVMVKNAVKPSRLRRKSTWRTPETVDPFIQKFSTREKRKTTPPNRKTSRVLRKNSSGDIIVNVNTTDGASTIEKDFESDVSGIGNLYDTEFGWSCFHRDRPLIFDPDGLFNYFWFYFLVFSIRYNLWALIARIAFPDAQERFRVVWFVFDYFCDTLYVLDIVICSCTGFLEEGILVSDKKRACLRYLLSKEFAADVISVLPLDLLYLWLGARPELRLNRLIKAYKSFKLKSAMESQAQYPTFLRVFFLLHLMLLLIHWNAAFYYMISRAEGFGTNNWVFPGNGSVYQQYLQSFYWSTMTLTAIGDLPAPITNLEFVYTIICYLTGVFMFATIVGNAGSIIVNSDASRVGFEKQRENTKQYMKKHNVPKDLQRRVIMWYDYSWTRGRMSTGGGDLNSITMLPDQLKTEIALHVNLETLSKVTFLQKCQPEFLHDLVLKMKLRIFTPGDLVCRKGEPAREMYVIISGVIEVIGDAGQVLKVLRGGDFFGEIGILSLSEGQNRRTAVVRTVGYVECFVLSKDDVLSAIRDYPEAQAVLAAYGRKRLQRQNTAEDPRLVDMDDYNGNGHATAKEHRFGDDHRTPDLNKPRGQFQDTERPITPERLRAPPMHLIRSKPRRQLEPICPRRVQGGKVWDEPWSVVTVSEPDLGSCSDRSGDDDTSGSDEMLSSVLRETYADCVSNIQQAFDRKMDMELHGMKAQIKSLEQKIQSKEERITSLKEALKTKCKELQEWKEKLVRLDAENVRKQEVIVQMQKEMMDSNCLKSKRGVLVNTSTSTTSLMDDEEDTQC